MRQTSLAKVGRRLHKAGPLSDAVVVVGGGGGQGAAVSRGGCHLGLFIIGGFYGGSGKENRNIRRGKKKEGKKKRGENEKRNIPVRQGLRIVRTHGVSIYILRVHPLPQCKVFGGVNEHEQTGREVS